MGLQGVKGIYEKQGWFYFQPPTPRGGGAPRPKPVNLKTRDLMTAIQRMEEHRCGVALEAAVLAGPLQEVLPKYYASRREDSISTRRARKVILDGFMNDLGNGKRCWFRWRF